ncbi:MAG: quercetin 2,3-dioxygenase [Acidobacteriaceae bacterium]
MARQQYAVFRAFRRAGIVSEEFHSQGFTRKGVALEMAQLWINLRAKDKSAKAGYQTLLKAQIPNVALPGDTGTVCR